ncbi:hypothetical protein FRB94_008933 [Tulasnella sp. JGI-2019a]|nr:hypothetical protein FRB93_008203 [Tulasnella sp. JGI-2019a]KAG8995567.1 hypothetical protein FRB94_008933 [Tulasnella sp. JGI-2019a]KAG9027991.1 hypothetical protein FRB95_006997 [Tulasnella sp. JGI-2019a]
MSPVTRLNAVGYISSQNHPILVRTFVTNQRDDLKYHYVAHTSLDVIEERVSATKGGECYLGHLYSMEDLAVYGWVAPSKLKIVVALALTDNVVKDKEVVTIFKALHLAYHRALSNPFLRLNAPAEVLNDPAALLISGNARWKSLTKRVDAIGKAINDA